MIEREPTTSGACTMIGFLGLGWGVKVAAAMGMKWLTPIGANNAESYISKLHAAYKNAIGKEKIPLYNEQQISEYIAAATTETPDKVLLFVQKLKQLAQAGTIPYDAYDPSQSLAAKAEKFGGTIIDKAIIAGTVVLGAYLLLPELLKSMRKGTNP